MWPFRKLADAPTEDLPPSWLYDLLEAIPLELWALESGTMTCDVEIGEGQTCRVICQDRGDGDVRIGVSLVRKLDEKTIAATTRWYGPSRAIKALYDDTLDAHIEALELNLRAAAARVIAKFEPKDETEAPTSETASAKDETGEDASEVW